MELFVLKISSTSNPGAVAGAIAGGIRDGKKVELHTIGVGAVNQAVKAIATARGYVASLGINLSCIPAYINVELDGETRTGMKFILVTEEL